MAEIYICIHCHSYLKGKGKYCPDCNSTEKRRIMDTENKKLNPKFECHECKKIKE